MNNAKDTMKDITNDKPEEAGQKRPWKQEEPSSAINDFGSYRGILVIMVMSVILWHEKTKIRKIIGFGNFDVISVKTIIHNNNKKMGHLIWPLGV